MKRTKTVCFLLVLVTLLTTIAPSVAFAADGARESTAVSGYAYDTADRVNLSGVADINTLSALPASGEYKITDAEGLMMLASLVNGSGSTAPLKGVTVYLAKDIDMTDKAWVPIALFCGTFDGQGYQIQNLRMFETDVATVSLFAAVQGAVIKNLILDESCYFYDNGTSSAALAAPLVGKMINDSALTTADGYANVIKNIRSDANVYSQYGTASGLIGSAPGAASVALIQNCTNNGSVSADNRMAAGILGRNTTYDGTVGNISVQSCVNNGSIYGESKASGIVTDITGSSTEAKKLEINGCINYGAVSASTASGYAGAILCTVRYIYQYVGNCQNYGNISAYQSYGIWGEYVSDNGVSTDIISQNFTDNADYTLRPELIGYQVENMEGNTDTEHQSIRFIASIDSLGYSAVGFRVEVKETGALGDTVKTYERDCEYVYESLSGMDDGTKIDYTAEEYRPGGYLFAIVIEDIPASEGRLSFDVTPYCIKDGNKAYGASASCNHIIGDLEEFDDETWETENMKNLTNGSWFDSFKTLSSDWTVTTKEASDRISVTDKDETLYIENPESAGSKYEVFVKRETSNSENFEAEFKLKIDYYGGDNGIYLNYNGKRLVIYLFESKLRIGSGSKPDSHLVYTDIGYDWHTYRVVVNDNVASLWLDGMFMTTALVETWGSVSGTPTMAFFNYAINEYNPAKMQIEYASYTNLASDDLTITSPTARETVGTGNTDVIVTSALSSTLVASGIDVEFYLNGISAGKVTAASSVSMTFAALTPGVYSVYTKCGDKTSAERIFAVAASVDEGTNVVYSSTENLQSSYVLKYTVDGDGTVTAGDGLSRLNLHYADSKLTYVTSNGDQTIDAGNGDYIAVVDGGAAWLYRDGKMITSFILPYDSTCTNTVATEGSISNLTVEAHNATLFAKDFSNSASYNADPGYIPYEYALEFEYTAGREASVNFTDGAYLLSLKFASDGTVSGLVAPQKMAYVETLFTAQGSNLYRVYVSLGIAQIYVNNVWVKSLRLPDSIAARNLSVSGTGIGMLQFRESNDLFFYEGTPSDSDWDNYFDADIVNGVKKEDYHLLKTYSQNTTVSATVDLSAVTSGEFSLVTRYGLRTSTDESAIGKALYAGYADGCYHIRVNSTVLASTSANISGAVTLTLAVDGSAVTLSCNGTAVLSAILTGGVLNGWGNAGYYDTTDSAVLTSFAYEGDGNALSNTTTHYVANDHTVGIIEYEETVYVYGEKTILTFDADDDEAYTSTTLQSYNSYNTIVLESGKTLMVVRKRNASGGLCYYAYLSSDGGVTYEEGPFRVQEDFNPYRFTMNGKVMQAESGRVFFVSGETEDENIGMLWIYYSDDEGRTWQKSSSVFKQSTTGLNLQEGMIVELGNGKFRMYARNDCGFLYYSDSADNGETWSMKLCPSNFASVVSAFNVVKDKSTGAIYLAWEYNNTNDNIVVQYPRSRVGLAVSYDNAETWYYVGDIDEQEQLSYGTWVHMNIGVFTTGNDVYVTVAKKLDSDIWYNYMVRIAKDSIVPMVRFNEIHALRKPSDTNTLAEQYDMRATLVISSDGKQIYASGDFYSGDGDKSAICADAVASLLGGTLTTVDGNSVITIGAQQYTFDAGKITLDTLIETFGFAKGVSDTGAVILTRILNVSDWNRLAVHAGLQMVADGLVLYTDANGAPNAGRGDVVTW
ncbi:MAG: exo-alpha-sialidase [Clostridia bacterium]|nr:exo-alpha-sialidase [Clostridia bacterium]